MENKIKNEEWLNEFSLKLQKKFQDVLLDELDEKFNNEIWWELRSELHYEHWNVLSNEFNTTLQREIEF